MCHLYDVVTETCILCGKKGQFRDGERLICADCATKSHLNSSQEVVNW